jgi:hypothetical protein
MVLYSILRPYSLPKNITLHYYATPELNNDKNSVTVNSARDNAAPKATTSTPWLCLFLLLEFPGLVLKCVVCRVDDRVDGCRHCTLDCNFPSA